MPVHHTIVFMNKHSGTFETQKDDIRRHKRVIHLVLLKECDLTPPHMTDAERPSLKPPLGAMFWHLLC